MKGKGRKNLAGILALWLAAGAACTGGDPSGRGPSGDLASGNHPSSSASSGHDSSGHDSSSDASSEGAQKFKDGLGREVTIRIPVRKVISLAPSNTEILWDVGAGKQLVACDDDSDYPPEAAGLPRIGSTGGKLSLERILALEPDVLLAAEITSREQVGSLEGLGLSVYLVPNPTAFKGLFENISFVGKITGWDREAADLISRLEGRLAALEKKLRGVEKKPRVFYELDATDSARPWTVGPGTFLDTLLAMAGGQNMGAAYAQSFPRVSVEILLKEEPDVIVLGDAASGVTLDSVRRRPGWAELSAVKAGRVHLFDGSLGSRPGPRLVDGLEVLARILHPEAFER
jgi:iron complex transport system substrate-binding protein